MGKYEPDIKALMMLSEFFQVPIDYILGGNFTKWDFNTDGTLYPENYSSQLTTSETFVSEGITMYTENSKSNNTSGHHSLQTAFDRVEFTGLKQEEIDILADYAVFIKSRRKSEK